MQGKRDAVIARLVVGDGFVEVLQAIDDRQTAEKLSGYLWSGIEHDYDFYYDRNNDSDPINDTDDTEGEYDGPAS